MYIPGRQEAESCGCLLHCRTAPWPDSPGKGENYFLLSPAYFLAAFNLLQFCKLLLSKCLLTGILIPEPVPKSNHAKLGNSLNGSDETWNYRSPVLILWNWSPTKQRKVGPRMPWIIFYVVVQFGKDQTSSADSSSPPTKRSTSSTLS